MSSNIARRDISRAGIIFFTRLTTVDIIRVRVLFEGGSYMRKYDISFGNQRLLDLDISNALKVIIDFAHNAFPVQI